MLEEYVGFKMQIKRTLPPAAAPIGISELVGGICGIFMRQRELNRFESELKKHFGVRHCFLLSSGKAAFTVSLLALKELYPERNEVLIPAFTCYSVPSAIVRAGLKVRLCDLQVGSLDFDFSKLAIMLSETAGRPAGNGSSWSAASPDSPNQQTVAKILAVVPTHLFGLPSDIGKLQSLIVDPAITIVEDAAQAMCESSDGKSLGCIGDIGFFSLGRGKAVSTVEGGIIITNRDDIAIVVERIVGNIPRYTPSQILTLALKAVALSVFVHPWLHWLPRSLPFLKLGETLFESDFPILRMSPFQAGLARNWQVRLSRLRQSRSQVVSWWDNLLADFGSQVTTFKKTNPLALIRMPISVKDVISRRALLRESESYGLGIMPAYPLAINLLPELSATMNAERFPVAEEYARNLLTLPTHPYVRPKDVHAVHGLFARVLPCTTSSEKKRAVL